MIAFENKSPKIAFFGTPELTVTILNALKEKALTPSLIVTTKDMPKGRGLMLAPSAAKLWAINHHIPCLQPEKINDAFIETLAKQNFDLFVVVAYGKILPEKLIDTPRYGTINVHYSLLPKYRGATPVESAILNGDEETGVCIQKMAFALDTGAIVALEKMKIPKEITAPVLRNMLNEKAAAMLPNTIREYISGAIVPIPQNEKDATNCHKIKKEGGLIDLRGDPIMNDRKFRAYFAWPRTYFFVSLKDNPSKKIRVIVSDARLENDSFAVKKVIPEGKKEMPFEQFQKNYGF